MMFWNKLNSSQEGVNSLLKLYIFCTAYQNQLFDNLFAEESCHSKIWYTGGRSIYNLERCLDQAWEDRLGYII